RCAWRTRKAVSPERARHGNLDAAFPRGRADGNLSHVQEGLVQLISARTALHARARPEMAREACAAARAACGTPAPGTANKSPIASQIMLMSGPSKTPLSFRSYPRENPMTTLGKTIAALVLGLSASMLAPIAASAALTPNITAQCNAQVRATWP